MGFGSYDESDRERQRTDSAEADGESLRTEENAHEGEVEYEIDASNDELLEKLKDIKRD